MRIQSTYLNKKEVKAIEKPLKNVSKDKPKSLFTMRNDIRVASLIESLNNANVISHISNLSGFKAY